jgi:hypothetical protein
MFVLDPDAVQRAQIRAKQLQQELQNSKKVAKDEGTLTNLTPKQPQSKSFI